MSYLPKREYICNYCNQKFYRYGNRTAKYCSRVCANKGQQKRVLLSCVCCGKQFERTESDYKWCKERGYRNNFCSHKCRVENNIGEKHPSWKGGRRYNDMGYVMRYCPQHPKNIYGYYFEHRIIMEEHLGRYLDSSESIHHINGKKDDNRLENLQVMTNSEHSKLTYRQHKHKLSKRKVTKEQLTLTSFFINNKI